MGRLDDMAKQAQPEGQVYPVRSAETPQVSAQARAYTGRESYEFPATPAPATAPRPVSLTTVSIGQLYVFLWKLALASLLFALPFVLIYAVMSNLK